MKVPQACSTAVRRALATASSLADMPVPAALPVTVTHLSTRGAFKGLVSFSILTGGKVTCTRPAKQQKGHKRAGEQRSTLGKTWRSWLFSYVCKRRQIEMATDSARL